MQINPRYALLLCLFLAGAAALAADADDIDRIIAAVGVDSIHSEDEEPRTRQAITDLLTELVSKSPTARVPQRGSPEFEALVRQTMEGQQRMRRDPLVFGAYRTTLAQMLSPDELATAAAFYGSPVGRKAHIAVIEAEKAAALAMDEVAARQK